MENNLAKIIVITRTRLCKKQGSALLLTVLTLAFLFVLIGGFNFDRQIRYWLSHNRRDELVSFYNAQSAYTQAEYELVEQYKNEGLLENTKKSFPFNEGICQYLWAVQASELKLQGIGIFEKCYSLLQGSFHYYSSQPEYPLLWVTEQVKSTGELQITPQAIEKGIFLPLSTTQIRLSNGLTLSHLVHCNSELTPTTLLPEEITAFALLSEATPEYTVEDYILTLLSNPIVTAAELGSNHIYFSKSDVYLDVRQAGESVELPSLISCQSIQILSRPEQNMRCRGLLYAKSLSIQDGTLLLEPFSEFFAYIENHKELFIPKNFRAIPQLILAQKELRFLPERIVGE